jgi:hypothetical protein
MPNPGSEFFYPGSRYAYKKLSIFNPKNCFYCFYALGKMILDLHPGSWNGSGFFSIPVPGPVSRIQGSKKHLNPDPDPKHWYRYVPNFFAIPWQIPRAFMQ